MNQSTFISYRHGQGAEIARAIKAELKTRGVAAFLDVDNLPAGNFDESLLRQIEQSQSCLVILTPGALDRCTDEKDWLRRELAHALKRTAVIPILTPGFVFPRELPPDISEIVRCEGVPYNHAYFEAMVQRIVQLMNASERKELRIVIRQGLDVSEAQVRETSTIENLVYASNDFIAGPDTYAAWYNAFPDSFVIAFDSIRNTPVGALIALPLQESAYERMRSGEALDGGLSADDIVPMDLPDQYDVYIADVMVTPGHQKWSDVLPRLLDHYVRYLIGRAQDEVFVRRMLADVCSGYGTRLCDYSGMGLVRESSHGSKLYEAKLIPMSVIAKNKLMRELRAAYSAPGAQTA